MTHWILSSSVMILAVLLIRGLFGRRIDPRLRYGLWLVVAVRLMIPFTFGESVLSIQHGADAAAAVIEEYTTESRRAAPSPGVTYEPVSSYAPEPTPAPAPTSPPNYAAPAPAPSSTAKPVSWIQVLQAVYFVGAVLVGLYFIMVNLCFSRRLKRDRVQLDLSFDLPVYQYDKLDSPCLFGLVDPNIYVNRQISPQNLHHILTHELTHYRHGDHIWAAVRLVCLTLHWYNPLVWLAAGLSRQDGEGACDTGTIARLGEAERLSYGRTLVEMVGGQSSSALLATAATTMSGGKRSLRTRIEAIACQRKTMVPAVIAVVLLVSLAVGCTFAGAPTEPLEEDTMSSPATLVYGIQTARPVDLLSERFTPTGDERPDWYQEQEELSFPVLYQGEEIVLTLPAAPVEVVVYDDLINASGARHTMLDDQTLLRLTQTQGEASFMSPAASLFDNQVTIEIKGHGTMVLSSINPADYPYRGFTLRCTYEDGAVYDYCFTYKMELEPTHPPVLTGDTAAWRNGDLRNEAGDGLVLLTQSDSDGSDRPFYYNDLTYVKKRTFVPVDGVVTLVLEEAPEQVVIYDELLRLDANGTIQSAYHFEGNHYMRLDLTEDLTETITYTVGYHSANHFNSHLYTGTRPNELRGVTFQCYFSDGTIWEYVTLLETPAGNYIDIVE